MEETLALEADNPNAAELQAAITRCLTKIKELRERMHTSDSAIEAAREETRANLADIAEVLAELKAA